MAFDLLAFINSAIDVASVIVSPLKSSAIAAALVGHPEIADDLQSICHRESRCTAVRVHEIDRHLSDRGWHGQVALGHLDPKCQPYEKGQWATRGAFGLSAASHWGYLPPCYPPEVLDVPIVSAMIAARKYVARCKDKHEGWCRVPRKVRANNRWQ